MKLNKQEKLIKTKMQTFEPKVDTDALWDSLAEHVPEKKKRRRGFYFILAASIILISGLILFEIKSQQSTVSSTQSSVSSKQSSISSQKSTVSGQHSSVSGQQSEVSSHQSSVSSHQSIDESILSSEINNKTKNKVPEGRYYGRNNQIKIIKVPEGRHYNDQNNKQNTTNYKQKTIRTLLPNPLNTPELLPLNHKRNLVLIPSIKINSHLKTNKQFACNIGIGLGNVEQSFYAETPESKNYSDYLTSVSNSKPSLLLNIGVSYYLNKNIYFNSGLQFNRLVNQIHSKMIQLLHEEKETPEGLIQRTKKELEYEAIGHNYHYTIDLPVNIGVNLFKSKNMNISLEGGVLLNLLTYSKGKILNSNYKLLDYNNTTGNPYKNFKIAWQSSIVIDYKLGSNTMFYLKPSFTHKNIKYNIDNNFIKESYNIFGLNVGLRYRM